MTDTRACDKQNEIFVKKYMARRLYPQWWQLNLSWANMWIASTMTANPISTVWHFQRTKTGHICIDTPPPSFSSILRFKHAKPTQPLLTSPMYGRGGIDSERPTIFMTLSCTQLLGLNMPYNKNREGVSAARSKRIACVQTKADAKTSFYQVWMTSDKQCMDRPLILNSNWTRATRCGCIQNAQADCTGTCISHILRFASGFSNHQKHVITRKSKTIVSPTTAKAEIVRRRKRISFQVYIYIYIYMPSKFSRSSSLSLIQYSTLLSTRAL